MLEKVNDQLCENNEAEMFVTVWLGVLEISTGRLVCAPTPAMNIRSCAGQGATMSWRRTSMTLCWPA